MEILLRYDNGDRKDLVISSKSENTFDTLIKYLTKIDVPFVENLPEKQGVYCTPDDDDKSYDAYQIILDKEDNTYNSYYLYSLKWLPYTIDEVSLLINESLKAEEKIAQLLTTEETPTP